MMCIVRLKYDLLSVLLFTKQGSNTTVTIPMTSNKQMKMKNIILIINRNDAKKELLPIIASFG